MSDYQLLLASNDQTLILAFGGIAAEHNLSFETIGVASIQNHRHAADLIVLHVTDEPEFHTANPLLKHASEPPRQPRILVILENADPRRELALLQAGAVEVFIRPLDLHRVSFVVNSLLLAAEFRVEPTQSIVSLLHEFPPPARTPRESLTLKEMRAQAFAHGILFRSEKMLRLMDRLRHVVSRDSNILISGETGTGKTRLARLIHDLSPRRQHPFVVANCAAITPSLLESELFGHARGAFTGASQSHEGKFHAAQDGTLFLDEIDSLPASGQQRLLHVLDQRVFEKVGSNEPEKLRARVIAAANRPLEKLVATGQFRSDLYYRLKVVTVDLPALRERPEDIEPIARHLLREEAHREGDPLPELTGDLLDRLTRYDWPGNIRELRNVVSQLVVFAAGGPLSLSCLPEFSKLSRIAHEQTIRESASCPPGFPSSEYGIAARIGSHDEYESDFSSREVPSRQMRPLQLERARGEANRILQELRRHNHNRTKTAQSLGISRNALYKRLKKLNLAEVR